MSIKKEGKDKNKNNKYLDIQEYKNKYKEYLLGLETEYKPVETCSSKLNKILNGGIQQGKIVELYGHEGSGKSSLSLSISAFLLEKYTESFILIIDTEGGICSKTYLNNIGLNLDRVIILHISEGDKVFSIVEEVIKDSNCIMVVIDSVAGLLTDEDLDGSNSLGSHSRLMSQKLRKLTGILNQTNSKTIIILINQLRNKINDLWKGETNYTTTGGKALKYFASFRFEISRTEYIQGNEQKRIGFYAKLKVVKSRMSIPHQECIIPFRYGMGFSKIVETIDELIEKYLIEKSGPWFYINIESEKFSFRSKFSIIQKCEEDIVFFTKLKKLNN